MFARDGLVKLYTELLLYLKERINLIYNINVQGENVYEIPETEKYVGSYDTAVSSVNPKDLKRTVVEHYKWKLEFLNTMFIQMDKLFIY